ncbi:hypothetical protein [Micromonospora sp. NPDC005174]|uniref:hypothetical protein n=1 Tax=Micromonospora sp. NPDC005174 TaxID=3157018 RepID=UPI0033BEAE3B
MTTALARPNFPAPQPGNPFPAPSPNPTLPRQQATCPTCGNPVGSLLAACWATPECLRADLDYDAAIDARCDDL